MDTLKLDMDDSELLTADAAMVVDKDNPPDADNAVGNGGGTKPPTPPTFILGGLGMSRLCLGVRLCANAAPARDECDAEEPDDIRDTSSDCRGMYASS